MASDAGRDRGHRKGVHPPAAFVRANTRLVAVPFVPELRLHLADDVFALWERIEATTGPPEAPLPFWTFAWAGGQALARYVLDQPALVRGRRILDVGSGSGLVAIAAAKAGAAEVTASDVDRFAIATIALNAEANGVVVATLREDVLDGDGADAEVLLAADLFYEQPLAERVAPFLERARARGAMVLVGDPGRAYLLRNRFEVLATYAVPVMRTLEDAAVKPAMVWRPLR
jgi:predicted nicotinamide N-methyase